MTRLFEGASSIAIYATQNIYRSPNMLTFIRAYPETFLDHDLFQQILLKAATVGNSCFILNILQITPYRAHPETMKKILKLSRRRYNKWNKTDIHHLTKLWLNTYADPHSARQWVDPNDIVEVDLSGFDAPSFKKDYLKLGFTSV